MEQELVVWAVAFWFVLFLVLGQHVATVLFSSGMVGIYLWVGPQVFGGILARDIFYTASTYSLSLIPLYLLMAQLLLRGGVVVDLFRVGYRLAGYRRFPLGVATVISGGMLGAVSGSGAATSAALATLASPQLESVGYTRRMGVALAAIAGSLSAIIPPSLIMIIYGSLTRVSIGHLFIGALLPAVVCVLVYIVCLRVFGETRPESERNDDRVSFAGSQGGGLGAFCFVVTLMVVIFGGIYGGIVTAGEAGALGAFTALVGMLTMQRIGFADIAHGLGESVKVTGMIMIIVLGAQIFGRFLSYSRVPRELLALLEPFLANPDIVVISLLAAFFVFGLFLESAAVMVLLIPIIMPVLEAAEVNMLWFGVMASFMISLGLLTPPVGLAAYAASSAANEPVGPVFRVTGVFALFAAVLVSAVMILFPEVVTWLPGTIR